MVSNGSAGMSGHNFDAFVSAQRTFNDYDLAAKIQETYWRARQKFLAKVERKEDACIVLSDTKLDAKLEIHRSIDSSCAKLTNILENYQNCLYLYANEENSLGILLKECSKHDKTKAGKIMSIAGKSLTQASHQDIKLYMPLLRLYQEMETFHSRAVEDTADTVDKLESKRSQYRASLLWMKDISEKLDPDVYSKLDKFRRIQNQVRTDKKSFDNIQLDVVQKIDLLMASRCNLMNQILAAYQSTLLETLEKNYHNFKSVEDMIKGEDIYEYEFKTLKQLNPLQVSESNHSIKEEEEEKEVDAPDLMQGDDIDGNNNASADDIASKRNENLVQECQIDALIDVSQDDSITEGCDQRSVETDPGDPTIDELDALFGNIGTDAIAEGASAGDRGVGPEKRDNSLKILQSNLGDLLNMETEDQIANLLGPSESKTKATSEDLLGTSIRSDCLLSDWSSVIDAGRKNPLDVPSSSSNPKGQDKHEEIDLMGAITDQPTANPGPPSGEQKPKSVDLLTDELEAIDNSSYFKSLQSLQL